LSLILIGMNFEAYYRRTREEINERLNQILTNEVQDKDFHDLLHYAIEGGKRFRPTLTLLMFDMLQGKQRKKALTHGAIIELIHEASLVQDDALDYDKIRRGRDSLWVRLLKKSVRGLHKKLFRFLPRELSPKTMTRLMAGNMASSSGILALGLKLLDDPLIMRSLSEGMLSLSHGAMKEVDNMFRAQLVGTSEEKYLMIIKGKTASLFATSTHVGAISARVDKDKRENARQLGLYLGMCYQLADDVSEGDIPNGVDGKQLLIEQAAKYDRTLGQFKQNQYRDMFEQVLPYMINKLMAEENYPQKIVRTKPEVFTWSSRASTD